MISLLLSLLDPEITPDEWRLVPVQIAGLDVGWGQRIDLTFDPKANRLYTERTLPAGKFPYRFVYDDELWTTSADHPVMKDGEHFNNYVEVVGATSPQAVKARSRIMSEAGELTAEEQAQLQGLFADGRCRSDT